MKPITSLFILFFTLFISADSIEPSLNPVVYASDSVNKPVLNKTIHAVIIRGNKRTQEFVIRGYLPFDTRSAYDSSMLSIAKRRLERTGLFSEVNLFAIQKAKGVDIHIIVAEMFFIPIDNAGLTYYSRRYGQDYGWLKFSFGLTDFNFGGRAESFAVWGSFWESKGLGVSWSKPLLPSPYSLSISASVNEGPDLLSARRLFFTAGSVSVGRKLFENSRVSLSITPIYSILDTVDAPSLQHKFYETFIGLGWSTDRRDHGFAPSRGWSFSCEAKSNYLLTADSSNDAIPLKTSKYAQFSLDARLYHRGIFENHVVGYWLKTTVRDADGGPFRILAAGSDGSLRGYRSGELGGRVRANDRITFALEYRYPIWTAPIIEFPWLDNLPNPLRTLAQDATKGFFYRFDGAMIADGALLWNAIEDIAHPFTMDQEHGLGLGCGLRLLYPNLRRSFCIDIVYPVYIAGLPAATVSTASGPTVHWYIDMYF